MRSSGVLLHPTSLPGPGAVGTLGAEARTFIDWLAAAGQRWWQVLPLGPVGFGSSPYMAMSAFAGNTLLIDAREVAARGWIDAPAPAAPRKGPADYAAAEGETAALVARAREGFAARATDDERAAYAAFCAEHAAWLEDYALFASLSRERGGRCWNEWEPELVRRDEAALDAARTRLAADIERERFAQYLFVMQWSALRSYAHERNVRIIGDLPIFVSLHSADVWCAPHLFELDAHGNPTVVAGVPPDYFSPTGQRWGNPLYRWNAMAEQGYRWWIERFRGTFALVDCVRVDHFRGFEAYWEVPAHAETAIDGRWVPGPGRGVFDAVFAELGHVDIIAEDLGIITAEVDALRKGLDLPGMRVLQFAFGGDDSNPHLPHNHEQRSVVYTGTHDNDTTRGWYDALDAGQQHEVRVRVGSSGTHIAADLTRWAFGSIAERAVVPVQDVLGLGSWARLNTPGVGEGNWLWRMDAGAPSADSAAWLASVARETGRG
jgi:4-alpha-glucanotransferase